MNVSILHLNDDSRFVCLKNLDSIFLPPLIGSSWKRGKWLSEKKLTDTHSQGQRQILGRVKILSPPPKYCLMGHRHLPVTDLTLTETGRMKKPGDMLLCAPYLITLTRVCRQPNVFKFLVLERNHLDSEKRWKCVQEEVTMLSWVSGFLRVLISGAHVWYVTTYVDTQI